MKLSAVQPSRASPRSPLRKQLRRETIVDVASSIFLRQGYAATTMSAVAAELGGSKGTLWSYFPSKPLLFDAVLDRSTNMLQVQLSKTLAYSDDIENSLRQFCSHLLRKTTSGEVISLCRLIYAEAGRAPEIGDLFFKRAMGATEQKLADFLKVAMDQGKLRPDEPLRAARALLGLCHAGSHYLTLFRFQKTPSDVEIEQDVECALSIFIRAYTV